MSGGKKFGLGAVLVLPFILIALFIGWATASKLSGSDGGVYPLDDAEISNEESEGRTLTPEEMERIWKEFAPETPSE